MPKGIFKRYKWMYLNRRGKNSPRYSHGMRHTLIYDVWSSMKQRCNNIHNKNYKHYGGRGIKVCKRWNKFEHFYSDMGEKPKNMWIERINNNRGYSKRNCKWSTVSEQAKNTRKFITINIDKKKYSLNDLVKLTGIKRGTLYWRIFIDKQPVKKAIINNNIIIK